MVSSVPGFDLSHLNSPASIDSHIKTPLQSETDPTATRERSVAMVLQLEGSRIPTGGSSGVISKYSVISDKKCFLFYKCGWLL